MIVEESSLIDGSALQEIVIPMMNISRRTATGRVIEGESNQAQCYITTAGDKTCFMYQKLIEMVEMECLTPSDFFVMGMDYRIPVMHGLLSKQFLDEQRLSSTFDEMGFARESLSIWTGQSKDSWFNNKQLLAHRKILKCERKTIIKPGTFDTYYEMGVDVGRYSANTAIVVVKVHIREGKPWKKKVVYIEVINGENLVDQATKIKQCIRRYNPREVVVDGNGLGAGLMDALVRPSFDLSTGESIDPYYAFNDVEYSSPARRQVLNAPDAESNTIIYNLKAGSRDDNSAILSNTYGQITSGNVDFLAHERVVKEKLLSTKKGQKMSLYDRYQFLLPYEMTSRLMDEINNLKIKPTGNQNKLEIEQISRSMPKDRWSALSYALWRIKTHEDESIKHRRRSSGLKDYLHFTTKRGK